MYPKVIVQIIYDLSIMSPSSLSLPPTLLQTVNKIWYLKTTLIQWLVYASLSCRFVMFSMLGSCFISPVPMIILSGSFMQNSLTYLASTYCTYTLHQSIWHQMVQNPTLISFGSRQPLLKRICCMQLLLFLTYILKFGLFKWLKILNNWFKIFNWQKPFSN